MQNLENEKLLAARAAVNVVRAGQTIGLGTGSTAEYAIKEIGSLVKNGLRIKGVATSDKTADLARSLNIPLVAMDDVDSIDLTIDGADEFDADLNLIKGGGGALFREKMAARLSANVVIIADSSKKVRTLGAYKVPVEVVPVAVNFAKKRIAKIGGAARIRENGGRIFTTDAGNRILDADFGLIENVRRLSAELDAVEGVVCHGLFIDLAQMVIMGKGTETVVFRRN